MDKTVISPAPISNTADFVDALIHDRDALAIGDIVSGPAIVEQSDTTTLIEPGWTGRVADHEVLILTRDA